MKAKHAYIVTINTLPPVIFNVEAKTVGHAVALVRRQCCGQNISTMFATDHESGGWKNVSVECVGQRTATLPQGGSVVVTKGSGNSKWHRRMEAAGIESHGNPKPCRERPQPDGLVYRRAKPMRPDGNSGLSVLLNKPGLRKRPSSRKRIADAVLAARQDSVAKFAGVLAIGPFAVRAENRDKAIKERALKAVAA